MQATSLNALEVECSRQLGLTHPEHTVAAMTRQDIPLTDLVYVLRVTGHSDNCQFSQSAIDNGTNMITAGTRPCTPAKPSLIKTSPGRPVSM